MKAKFLAACHMALISVTALTVSLLLLPSAALAELLTASELQKSDLITTQDFLEYASANQVDIHEFYFDAVLYEGTESCLLCHEQIGLDNLSMGHFKWEGQSNRIVGLEGQVHGKKDLLNNFCVAVPSNEGRCTQCHTGLGWVDKTFNFQNPAKVDCLVCHDGSGTYKKGKKTGGLPEPTVDLNLVARSVTQGAKPPRKNCIACHAFAGGGDNVKHGDISSDLIATTRQYDVHMGTDGANFDCVDCHGANHEPDTGDVNHGNAGMSLHSVHEGEMKQCADCHGSAETIHADTMAADTIFAGEWHERLACQVCHIPAIARKLATKTEWYWEDAGKDISSPPDPETGKPTFDKMKGTFVWKKNLRPELRYANGKWERMVINKTDTYDEEPIQMAVPQGGYDDPNAMIYPFKLMKGNQPVDPVNRLVLVPHLFGTKGGPNPFWGKWDWNLALQDGANYTGQNYSGTYAFGKTEMLLSVNHEVAPAENALGYGAAPDACLDCHSGDAIDWEALGWTGDPLEGGDRESAAAAAAPTVALPTRGSALD